ncbi:MAG TPA: hypothetical protein EYH38_02660 [Leucothrix sp.]|nr:hypothetical protein [Leucothrix sp.]
MYKLLFVLCLLLSNIAYADNWQLTKEGEGIQVFTRATPGSAIKAFKGVVSIPARLTSIVAIIDDTSVYTRLFYNTKSAKELKKMGDMASYKYVVTALPWPAQGRDSIIHSVLKQDKQSKTIQITMQGVPKYLPLKPGLVRIKKMTGRWLLIPEKESVKVVYEMNVDPGGNLPKWLVNSMSVDLPFSTLKNLRSLVKQAKYQKAKRPFIVD